MFSTINVARHARILMLGLVVASPASWAADVKPLIGIDADFGGETLYTAVYSDGSTQDIKSHQGLILYAGALFPVKESWQIQTTIGYKMATIQAKNGSIDFTRVPIEALGFKTLGPHRVGGGISYHTAGSFSCKVSSVCDFSLDMESATGIVMEYDYTLIPPNGNTSMLLGIRYAKTSYKFKGGSTAVDASGVGVNFGVAF